MSLRRKVLWSVLLVSLVATSAVPVPAQQVTLLAEGSPQHFVAAYYLNEFQDHVPVRFQVDSVTGRWQPVRLATTHPLWLQWSNGLDQYTVYARPGDTLYVQTHPRQPLYYSFHARSRAGVHQAELAFFNRLKQQGLGLGLPDAMGLFVNARYPLQLPRLRAKRDQRLALLHRYHDSLPLSAAFFTFARQQIQAQYLAALLGPYYDPAGGYTELPGSYSRVVEAAEPAAFLTSDTLVQTSQVYRACAVGYVRYRGRAALGTADELTTLYQLACTLLRGKTRDYVLFALLKQQVGKLLPSFSTYSARFQGDCATPAYRQYLDSVCRRPTLLAQLPALLNTSLRRAPTGDTLTWRQLVANNRGRVVYLDLWASWCGPCLAEMPASAQLQTQLRGQPVQFVYVSLDRDSVKWRQALRAQQLVRPNTQHYLLAPDSPLATFLQVPPIPRYVLLDQQGQAVSLDAARPRDPLLLTDLAHLFP
ncbi:TlpA family protein disulfide reductase [Hymenobacter sp. YC55]|uniref:TlpA family protein disulfide reductase n=1 Tax=Hymenobacter sp. YC55 TaxID=3034019 RepID=UPI0023F71337|nr:TlpA family protein disulfide reductase [Hymenobacter sp. YC55]MDF7813835.1 TlpA family protein disulfide reductase [Hymenobacter sp. YC55]